MQSQEIIYIIGGDTGVIESITIGLGEREEANLRVCRQEQYYFIPGALTCGTKTYPQSEEERKHSLHSTTDKQHAKTYGGARHTHTHERI